MGVRQCLVAASIAACSTSDPSADTDATDAGTADSGSTAVSDTSTIPTDAECGNGVHEVGEECDGVEPAGATCVDAHAGYADGAIACGASCTFDAADCVIGAGAHVVTINEVTSESVAAGEYAGPNDAIELYNGGSAAADLSGWLLSDDPELPSDKTYVFPAGTSLAPGAHLVVRSLDAAAMTGEFPFGISDSNVEMLVLADGAGTWIDSVSVDGTLARASWCRFPDAHGPWFQCDETFGGDNALATTICGNGLVEDGEACDSADLAGNSCAGLEVGYTGGVLVCSPLCELDADGCTTTSDVVINELESTTDAIELYNGGEADVDLSGWALTDENVGVDYDVAADPGVLVFAEGTVLAAGEYLVVPRGTDGGQHPFGLDDGGDTVALVMPMPWTIVDQVTYDDGTALVSYCRLPNGPGGPWRADCAPTMGAAN